MIHSTRTRETRTIALTITGAPDLLIPGTDLTIAPASVELTYRWPSGATSVEIRGPRRTKTGRTTSGTKVHMLPGDPWPAWLVELVDEYRPDNWPTNH